jgi:hypothetical protein
LIPENPDESELSRTEYVESAAYLERRLTQRGVDLLRERVETLGLEPGCRSVQTRESSGAVYMRSEEGVVGLTWYPYEARSPNIGQYGLLRRATVEEEETLAELSADLSDMEAWLPPDAWTDPLESRVQPETWLVVITLSDSIKSSAQYTQISLPGGVEPGDFGTEILVEAYDVAEATETRCGLIGRSDALALAESLDESGRPSWIRVLAGIPGGVDCDWYEDQDAASRASAEPTPFVDGEFANFDVCSLVSRSAADAISAADPQMIPRRGLGRLGETWDPSCEVMDAAVMGARANVMLHSRRVSASEAEPLALQLLGGATLEEVIAGESVWINECLADDLPCWWGVVASSDPYLIVITMDARDDITTDDARDLVRSILEALDARD